MQTMNINREVLEVAQAQSSSLKNDHMQSYIDPDYLQHNGFSHR